MGKSCLRLVLLFCLLVNIAVLAFSSSAEARPPLRVGIHKIGTEITEDSSGVFYGMDTDFMQALGSYAGREVIFVPGSWQECQERLASGEVDVLAGIIKTPEREKTMLFSRLMMGRTRFNANLHGDMSPFHVNQLYFAVNKDNPALMEELNTAADQLIANRPYYVSHLYQLYYGQQSSMELHLTPKEASFLKMHPVISAVVIARERPFAYTDEHGELQGVLRKLADRIEQDLSIKLHIITVPTREDAQEALENGSAQILLNSNGDVGWAAAQGMDLTTAYLTSYYTAVTRRSSPPAHPRVACLKSRTTERLLRQRYDEDQLQTYETVDDCLQAVRSGKADIAFLKQETAQYNIWQGDFPDLTTDGLVAFSQDVTIGVANTMEPELLSILDKEIAFIGPNSISDYFSFYDQKIEKQRSIRSLFYAYPQYFASSMLLLLVVMMGIFWRYAHMRRSHVAQMQQVIDTDRYTGLHNRSWFERKASEYLTGQAHGDDFAIVKIGISRLDIIVETYGEDVIIQLLHHLEKDLQQLDWAKLPAVHTSVGKAFFLVRLSRFHTQESFYAALQQLIARNEYINIGHMVVHIGFQIGICRISPDLSITNAMNHADLALHEAHPIRTYNAPMQQKAEMMSRMESLQQEALARKEFEIWYQPKYDIRTRRCIGAEALVRWRSHELGLLPPGQFISLFESNGFITQLDFYMLGHVMEWQKRRRTAGLPVVPVSVNQSRLHMQEKNYLNYMQRLVVYYSAKDVELELTETAFAFKNPELRQHALSVGHALHEMGFRLDIDDFGSGYSDLTLLNAMPFSVVKLDRSLLLASEGAKRMQSVLAHIIDLGHALGMTVICEGIETREQEELLLRCGCSQGQGYLYGKPMKEKDFERFLLEHI